MATYSHVKLNSKHDISIESISGAMPGGISVYSTTDGAREAVREWLLLPTRSEKEKAVEPMPGFEKEFNLIVIPYLERFEG